MRSISGATITIMPMSARHVAGVKIGRRTRFGRGVTWIESAAPARQMNGRQINEMIDRRNSPLMVALQY
jgi:hypothetical protein